MKWFKTCRTAEEGKHLYKELLKKYHPDNCAGDQETMKEINAEFEEFWEVYKDVHTNSEGKRYTSEKTTTETAQEYMDLIWFLFGIKDIKIEIIGSWVWITGNTFPVKDSLKERGFTWSKSKKAWYFVPGGTDGKKRRFGMDLDKIRQRFGCTEIEKEKGFIA